MNRFQFDRAALKGSRDNFHSDVELQNRATTFSEVIGAVPEPFAASIELPFACSEFLSAFAESAPATAELLAARFELRSVSAEFVSVSFE